MCSDVCIYIFIYIYLYLYLYLYLYILHHFIIASVVMVFGVHFFQIEDVHKISILPISQCYSGTFGVLRLPIVETMAKEGSKKTTN